MAADVPLVSEEEAAVVIVTKEVRNRSGNMAHFRILTI
jgi:hypothetical protein